MTKKYESKKQNTVESIPEDATRIISLKPTENAETSDKTITFSIKRSETSTAKTATKTPKADSNAPLPTSFEDIFSKEEIKEEVKSDNGVVSIEELFREKSARIDHGFHNETATGDYYRSKYSKPEKKTNHKKIAIGIISAVLIVAAVVLFFIFR